MTNYEERFLGKHGINIWFQRNMADTDYPSLFWELAWKLSSISTFSGRKLKLYIGVNMVKYDLFDLSKEIILFSICIKQYWIFLLMSLSGNIIAICSLIILPNWISTYRASNNLRVSLVFACVQMQHQNNWNEMKKRKFSMTDRMINQTRRRPYIKIELVPKHRLNLYIGNIPWIRCHTLMKKKCCGVSS